MDHGQPLKRAIGFLAIAAFAQDPSEMLERARGKILSEVPSGPRYSCVETIDRKYFSREVPPIPLSSCERLSADRKKGRTRLRLDATDRLRVEVAVTEGREIYSWTRPGSFSYSVEEILQFGPIGTGAFAVHLIDIFSNPSVRFRVLPEGDKIPEYGFRVPIEASRLFVRAGGEWRPTGYSGSFTIDPNSLEVRRFKMESNELPSDTSLCEVSTENEYQGEKTLGLLLPSVSRSHDILRDSSETEEVTTFSDCHEATASSAEREPAPDLAPPEQSFELALSTPIDMASAAAGDIISAQLTEPIWQPKSLKVLVPRGSTVTGRIVHMEHRYYPENYFVVSMAFDRLQIDGMLFKLRVKSDGKIRTPGRTIWYEPNSAGANPEWPMGSFSFPTKKSRNVIPVGFLSKWRTIAPASSE
jgi:hypothetical protein